MKILKLLMLTCGALLLTTILFVLPLQVSARTLTGINPNKSAPTGDPSVSYPQISIRTNRTPERTDLKDVISRADKAASQFTSDDQADPIYGHVAFVEAVHPDGSILISQSGLGFNQVINYQVISSSDAGQLHYVIGKQ